MVDSIKVKDADSTDTYVAGEGPGTLADPIYYRMAVANPATDDIMTVDSNGHGDVVTHAHPGAGHTVLNVDLSTVAITDYLLFDLSDTTTYPHDNTNWLHLENIYVAVDAANNADYLIEIGFLEDVDGTDGDFHVIYPVSGTRQKGVNQLLDINQAPNASQMRSSNTLTSKKYINDTAFNTGTNLRSITNPTSPDTHSGNGDIVMRVDNKTTNAINITVITGCHSH